MDLPILVDYFLDRHSRAFLLNPKPLSREMMRLMQQYSWPGNIRQLENIVRSYVLIGSEEALVADIAPSGPVSLIPNIDLAIPISLKELTKAATQDLERQIIPKVLQANGWSRLKTAKWLKISYRSLLYKLQESQTRRIPGQPRKAMTSAARPAPPQGAVTRSDLGQRSA